MKEPSRIYQVKIEEIMVDPDFNVRIDSEDLQQHIQGLATSIMAIGIKQPLTVHLDEDERTHLNDGFCRLAAVISANAEGANIETVPVRYDTKGGEAERVEGLLVRNGGRPLNLLEKSIVVKRLLDLGRDEDLISHRLGVSITHVKDLVLLSTVTDSIRKMIVEGSISPTNAIEAVRKFGERAEEALAEALNVVNGEGKKKVTQKQLGKKGKKDKIDYKVYGPRLRDMLHVMCFSLDTEEIKEANRADAIALLTEIQDKEG